MKTLYFDCFSGISGDMTVAALIDLGCDFDYLQSELRKLPLKDFELHLSRVERASISAAKFDVRFETVPDRGHTHRNAFEIIEMIRQSQLRPAVRRRAVEILERLAISEGQIHNVSPGKVEFHEVGAIDSIIDIVGAAIGFEFLGVEHFMSSSVNLGAGFVECDHGLYPVPAPATAQILTGIPVYSKYVEAELVTPTGAAILASTVQRFGPFENFKIDKVGYGAGSRQFDRLPNCLRLFLGETESEVGDIHRDQIIVFEANIDDITAEHLAYASEQLLAAGALDVITIPVQMKKGRSGHLIQVLALLENEEVILETLFQETTTIGIRMHQMSRRLLDREIVNVETRFGSAGVKVSRLEGKILNVSPEYDDCSRLARDMGRPFKDVEREILKSYTEKLDEDESNENV